MNNNYPPGFTQGDHDKEFAQEPECCKCGKKLKDEEVLFNTDDDSVWCYGCNDAAEQWAIDRQKDA